MNTLSIIRKLSTKSICTKALYFLAAGAIAVNLNSCTEESVDGDIVGKYYNLTSNSNTEITIQSNANGYSLKCIFDDNREENIKSYTWNGVFVNVPSDAVKDASGKEIGYVRFSKDAVEFEAYTQREGTYKGYRDDMADLQNSRSIMSDSTVVKNDSTMIENNSDTLSKQ